MSDSKRKGALMVKLLDEGGYRLPETKGGIKILVLGEAAYAWVDLEAVGEILVAPHKPHKTGTVLALGRYKLYDVGDGPGLPGQQQLELAVGNGAWRGYLLPTGLPKDKKIRSRIIPTKEITTPLKEA